MTQGGSSIPEVQALLAALVASKPHGRIAELGTAFGEGAKAIAGSLGASATFVTVEPDPERFAIAQSVLDGTRPVREAFLNDSRLVGVELIARDDMAIIIATRRS